MSFVSEAHVKYHLAYVHDSKCLHCYSYCENSCSETYALTIEAAGSKEIEMGQIEKMTAVKEAEVGLEEVVEELTANHLVDVENMALSIDTGYSDFEAEQWCKFFYFPSPMLPERNVKGRVLWWMYMEAYESSIDAQTLDVKRLEIQQCTYLNCGYTFLDIHCHYWQFHANYIKPNMKEIDCAEQTEIQKADVSELGSEVVEDTETVGNENKK